VSNYLEILYFENDREISVNDVRVTRATVKYVRFIFIFI